MSVNFYQTTWRNIPVGSRLHTCHYEDLRSHLTKHAFWYQINILHHTEWHSITKNVPGCGLRTPYLECMEQYNHASYIALWDAGKVCWSWRQLVLYLCLWQCCENYAGLRHVLNIYILLSLWQKIQFFW
jgi:hypothetical protein